MRTDTNRICTSSIRTLGCRSAESIKNNISINGRQHHQLKLLSAAPVVFLQKSSSFVPLVAHDSGIGYYENVNENYYKEMLATLQPVLAGTPTIVSHYIYG
jgi:hypothetical protein